MTKALSAEKKTALVEWFTKASYAYLQGEAAFTQEECDAVDRLNKQNWDDALAKGLQPGDMVWMLQLADEGKFYDVFDKTSLPADLLVRLKRHDDSRWNPETRCGVPPQNAHLYKDLLPKWA